MTDHRFTDAAPIAGTRRTQDGYLVADVRCARTGCQEYLGAELGLADRDRIVVYRPESAVFHRDSLATFAHKPVTLGHPAQDVSPETWKSVAVGDVGEEVARDGEFVRVSLKLMDAAAIKAVEDGVRELSMGYRTPIVMGDGVAPDGTRYQATMTGPITINHLALVPRARGGSQLRIGDDASAWGASPTMSDQKEDPMSDTLKTVVLGDKAVQIAAADASVLDAYKAAQDKRLADAQAGHDKVVEAKDEEIGALKADLQKARDAAITPEKVSALVADRVALEAQVKAVDATVEPKGLSDAALRKAAVVKRMGEEAVKDASDAEVAGMFRVLAADAARTDRVADAIKGADGRIVTLDGAYAERDAALRDAWMQPARKEA